MIAQVGPTVAKQRPEPFRPFPVDVLPEPVRTAIKVDAKAIGCDPSFVALPMLAALAAAIGNTRRIALKPGWTEPSVVWVAIVGDSGTLKSAALDIEADEIQISTSISRT